MSASQQAGMLTYDLRSRGTSSLYEFLYQSIREDIARGRIPCGTKLPSKRNLAQHLDIGVATVTAAYDQLITEGFVRTEQRRGYFVEDVSEFRCKRLHPGSKIRVAKMERASAPNAVRRMRPREAFLLRTAPRMRDSMTLRQDATADIAEPPGAPPTPLATPPPPKPRTLSSGPATRNTSST